MKILKAGINPYLNHAMQNIDIIIKVAFTKRHCAFFYLTTMAVESKKMIKKYFLIIMKLSTINS